MDDHGGIPECAFRGGRRRVRQEPDNPREASTLHYRPADSAKYISRPGELAHSATSGFEHLRPLEWSTTYLHEMGYELSLPGLVLCVAGLSAREFSIQTGSQSFRTAVRASHDRRGNSSFPILKKLLPIARSFGKSCRSGGSSLRTSGGQRQPQ